MAAMDDAMTPSITGPAFAIGMFSVAGCKPFAGLVFGQRMIALKALATMPAALGNTLTGDESTDDLLAHWEHNLPVLARMHAMLTDRQAPPHAAWLALSVPLDAVRIHAPVAPRQVFCCGANYFKHVVDLIVDQGPGANPGTEGMDPEQLRLHARQLMETRQREGTPYFFSKPVSAVTGPFDPIVIAPHAKKPDWELELAVVIGRGGHMIHRDQAMAHVAGYTIANDISNRDHIYRLDDMKALGTDWIASKSQPSHLPLGPFLVPATQVPDPSDLRITLTLNGDTMQDECTADMIFGVARQIEYLSSMVQLLPGDVICTGSPAGNGTHHRRFLRDGDVVDARITGLGAQRNHVRNTAHASA